MPYSYKDFTASEANDDLWSQVQNFLNSLGAAQGASTKIATSDEEGDSARAVVYYTNDTAPDSGQLGNSWSYQVFSTDDDYTNMYAQALSFLNSNEVNSIQKYYSHISMTNAHGSNSNVIVWFRNMPS